MFACILFIGLFTTILPVSASGDGQIVITNATIGETYRIYKLFDAEYSGSGTSVSTTYFATEEQKTALEAETDNVFSFTAMLDGTYLVEIGTYTDPASGDTVSYSSSQVTDFVSSYMLKLGSSLYFCNFPGAVLVSEDTAYSSYYEVSGLDYGYYFVTSSVGSVISLSTANPTAKITDKNYEEPSWDNDPWEPADGDPSKDVLNTSRERSINGDEVSEGDVLTYLISYTNCSGYVMDEVTVYDSMPAGTEYAASEVIVYDENGDDVTGLFTVSQDLSSSPLSWSVSDLPDGYTLAVYLTANVTLDAYSYESVENAADVKMVIGAGTYWAETNSVENPVYEDGDKPVKDVKDEYFYPDDPDTWYSIDGDTVHVGEYLTYTITYTNTDPMASVDAIICDKAPSGTMYISDSAASTLPGQTYIEADSDGTITWYVDDLAAGASVTVYFQVEVTDYALAITDNTIANSAEYSFDGLYYYSTNEVKNLIEDEDEPDEPDDEEFGKVIVLEDGSETFVSTGAFGDTVTFDVSIDAVNLVMNEIDDDNPYNDQVAYYYIYDRMDPGFTLNDDSFTVSVGSFEYEVTYVETLANGVKYYVIDDCYGSYLFSYVDTNTGYTVIEASVVYADPDTGTAYYPDCEIHLRYTADINTDAVIGYEGNWNRAIYDYSVVGDDDPVAPDPDYPLYPDGSDLNHYEEEITTVTYTYALGVLKTDTDGNALSGAVFGITDNFGNPLYAVSTGIDGVYDYTYDETAANAVKYFTSNAYGYVIIRGVDIGMYTLTEVQAPSGYILSDDDISVRLTITSSEETTYKYADTVWYSFEEISESEFSSYTGDVYTADLYGMFTLVDKPASYVSGLYKRILSDTSTSVVGYTEVQISEDIVMTYMRITNAAGFEMPGTGGNGVYGFYAAGLLLAAISSAVAVSRRRACHKQ